MLIQIQIAPHCDNRLLRVSAVSDDFTWHGEQPLDGEEGPRTVLFEVRHLPAGDYYVKGEVIGRDGVRGVVAKHITVMPRASPAFS